MRWTFVLASLLLSAGLLACTEAPPPAPAGSPGTRATMEGLVDSLAVALPLSLSESRFSAPENRETLERALDDLAANASAVGDHFRRQEAGYAYLSTRLERDAAEIAFRFRAGRPEEARFLLGLLTEDCHGCHARLSASGDSDLAARLFESAEIGALAPLERARLEMATRRFDAATRSFEALLADPAVSPGRLDMEGVLTDYLVLCVRVRPDPPRARSALARFRKRDDVNLSLGVVLDGWLEALAELEDPPGDGDLETARLAIARGQALRRFPADRAGSVHDLYASTLLNRYVTAHPDPSPETAEAYYLLGLAELRNDASLWLQQAEHYLETAIRMDPSSESARLAYSLLEEEVRAQYGGSAGVQLPAEVERWLAELESLVDPPAAEVAP